MAAENERGQFLFALYGESRYEVIKMVRKKDYRVCDNCKLKPECVFVDKSGVLSKHQRCSAWVRDNGKRPEVGND